MKSKAMQAAVCMASTEFEIIFQEVTENIEGHTICALGDAAAWPI